MNSLIYTFVLNQGVDFFKKLYYYFSVYKLVLCLWHNVCLCKCINYHGGHFCYLVKHGITQEKSICRHLVYEKYYHMQERIPKRMIIGWLLLLLHHIICSHIQCFGEGISDKIPWQWSLLYHHIWIPRDQHRTSRSHFSSSMVVMGEREQALLILKEMIRQKFSSFPSHIVHRPYTGIARAWDSVVLKCYPNAVCFKFLCP